MRYVVVATCELKVSDTHHPMTWVCSNGTSEKSFDSSEQDAYINNCALDYNKSFWLMIALCGTKLGTNWRTLPLLAPYHTLTGQPSFAYSKAYS
jgi:hypothetical protein